jgi:hypothetical protein
MQKIVRKNNSRALMLRQCDESFQASQWREHHPDKSWELKWLLATSRMSWPFVASGSGMMSPLQTNLNSANWAFPVMSGKIISSANVNYLLWLNILRHVLHMLTDSVMWHRDLNVVLSVVYHHPLILYSDSIISIGFPHTLSQLWFFFFCHFITILNLHHYHLPRK